MKEILLTHKELFQIRDSFYEELKLNHLGLDNSLSYLDITLPERSGIVEGQTFQSLSIGGTNFSIGLLKKVKRKLELLEVKEKILPEFNESNNILEFISNQLDHKSEILSIALAYPLKPIIRNGRIDGVFLRGTKEHDFSYLIGKNFGEELEKYILKNHNKKIKVSVANDTICAALSGLNIYDPKTIASLVLGTGTNLSYFEDTNRVVCLESGNFDKFKISDEVKFIDEVSKQPGKQLFEKSVSGGYIYKQYNYLIDKYKLDSPKLENTLFLDDVIKKEGKGAEISSQLYERSASLISAVIAGIYKFKNQKVLNLITEGSLFWNGYKYQQNVIKYLDILGLTSNEITFNRIKKGSLVGAGWLI